VKYGFTRKCWKKFDDETIHNLVNKLRTKGLLMDTRNKNISAKCLPMFGKHVHPSLIHVIFFWGSLRDKVYNSSPQTEEPKENILRKIANVLAKQLPSINLNIFHQCEECLRIERQHFQHLL
jgi:hypothetical protein